MIRAVLFDIGGVLTTSPFEAFARYERAEGLPEGAIRRVNATDPDTNAWARLERREIDVEEFGRRFEKEAEALGYRLDAHAVLALLGGDLRPGMVEAVRRCAARFKTAFVTNNFVAAEHPEPAMAELFSLVDAVFESRVLGVRKPDPRIYEIACDTLGVAPREAVLLDDLGVNLKPARALGMTTIKVVDPDDALATLSDTLGIALGT